MDQEEKWQKDMTPYIIFACIKCKQYMYVKTTQKTKKCLRCGRSHKVSDINHSGEIVKGMSAAVKRVKEKQEELAVKELGQAPEFRTTYDFKPPPKTKSKNVVKEENNDDYTAEFEKILKELTQIYSTFPKYMIEIWAEKYRIPKKKLKLLRYKFQNQGKLIKINNSTYKWIP